MSSTDEIVLEITEPNDIIVELQAPEEFIFELGETGPRGPQGVGLARRSGRTG